MQVKLKKKTPNLSRHDSMVAMDAIICLAETTAGFNKHASISYTDCFNQRLLCRILHRYKDWVHWIVGHSFTHMFISKYYRNIVLIKFIPRSDSTEQQ